MMVQRTVLTIRANRRHKRDRAGKETTFDSIVREHEVFVQALGIL